MLDNIAKQPASDQDPPHPVPLYTFKAPNGVWVPAPHFYRALRFQRHTGGFQRPIFIEHYGSSATLVDSSAPFLSSVTVPAPHWWIPAPHFYRASRFQRHTGGFQRPMFIEHCGSSATPVDSSAPFPVAKRFQRRTGAFQRSMFMQPIDYGCERSRARCVYTNHSSMFVCMGTDFVISHDLIMSCASCLAQRISSTTFLCSCLLCLTLCAHVLLARRS